MRDFFSMGNFTDAQQAVVQYAVQDMLAIGIEIKTSFTRLRHRIVVHGTRSVLEKLAANLSAMAHDGTINDGARRYAGRASEKVRQRLHRP